MERIGAPDSALRLWVRGVEHSDGGFTCPDHAHALDLALDALDRVSPDWRQSVTGVGHRVVHGGSVYAEPTLITGEVEAALDDLTELAPLHNGRAVQVLERAIAALPGVPQVACFDTMFHRDLPPESARYAIPRDLAERFGIRRYGFHGLSCAGALHALEANGVKPRGRVIICHLGAGSSVTAVRDGRSIDTSMGFTPLEGLIMATRSGSIDPSIPLFLQRHAGMSVDDVSQILERRSGLLALSGETSDVATLERLAASGHERAEEALAAYAYRVRLTIGAYLAALGGLDVLVFTGGIGEHSAAMRSRILAPLGHLGLRLDQSTNAAGASGPGAVSPRDYLPAIWAIPAREEEVIAFLAAARLSRQPLIR